MQATMFKHTPTEHLGYCGGLHDAGLPSCCFFCSRVYLESEGRLLLAATHTVSRLSLKQEMLLSMIEALGPLSV